MKKDRNSFFESSNFNMNTMGMNNMGGMGLMPQMSASSNFTASGNMPMPIPMPNFNNNSNSSMEIESRLAKLERSINRMDARISKLEGNLFNTTTYEADGNMYMV